MTIDNLEKKLLRLDVYLFYIRIFKSRNLATKFIVSSRIRLTGQVIQKPHKLVSRGDIITLPIHDKVKILKIVGIPDRRQPFSEVSRYYEDLTPIEQKKNLVQGVYQRNFVERIGRPTKLERRQTDKLMGRN